MKTLAFTAVLICLLAKPVHAQISVTDPWIRATVPPQRATGAFMNITTVHGGRLVEARSPVAGVVEIHEMRMENNVMRMRAIPGLDLPPGKPVALQPSGYHVMLMDLKRQMTSGLSVPITLVVEGKDGKRTELEVNATVRPLGAGMKTGAHAH